MPYYFSKNAYPKCSTAPGWKAESMACPSDDPLDTYSDYQDMVKTKEQLDYALNSSKPFFLAFGAHRPHLPWNCPRRFWDMYKSTESIQLPKHEYAPQGMPPIAFTYECDGRSEISCFNQSYPIPFPAANTALPHNVTRCWLN